MTMSSSSFSACARRVPLTTHTLLKPCIPATFGCHITSQHHSRNRTYATVSRRTGKLRQLHDVWGEFPDIPTGVVAHWLDTTRRIEKAEKGQKWLRFDDKDYIDLLEVFRNVAPLRGADWATGLVKDPAALNDLGCVLTRHAPQVFSLHQGLRTTSVIQLAMFSGAAHLGCETSALSMARWIALASVEDKDIAKRPLFRPTMDLHRRMLDEGKPMALYIEGELLFRTGKVDAAIRILDRVYHESDNTMIWWPEVCNILGNAYEQKQEPEIALQYWKEAAREGNAEALKGIFVNTSDEELRDDSIYKLACKGDHILMETIATIEHTKLQGEFDTKRDREFQEKWAAQWGKMMSHEREHMRKLMSSQDLDVTTSGVGAPDGPPQEQISALRAQEKQQQSER